MPEYDPVTKISIVPRGNAGGLTFFAPSEERLESGLYSRSYLENQMAVAMGGRVAEELIFGPDDVTTGASGDFQQVCSWFCNAVPPPEFAACKHLATTCSALSSPKQSLQSGVRQVVLGRSASAPVCSCV